MIVFLLRFFFQINANINNKASTARFMTRASIAIRMAEALPIIGSSTSTIPASRIPRPPGTNTATKPANHASEKPEVMVTICSALKVGSVAPTRITTESP